MTYNDITTFNVINFYAIQMLMSATTRIFVWKKPRASIRRAVSHAHVTAVFSKYKIYASVILFGILLCLNVVYVKFILNLF